MFYPYLQRGAAEKVVAMLEGVPQKVLSSFNTDT